MGGLAALLPLAALIPLALLALPVTVTLTGGKKRLGFFNAWGFWAIGKVAYNLSKIGCQVKL